MSNDIYSELVERNVVLGNNYGPETWTEAEVLRLEQQRLSHQLLVDQYPQLANDPSALYEIASNYDPVTAQTIGARMFGMDQLRRVANNWETLNDADRRQFWGQLNTQQRAAMVDYGAASPDLADDDPLLKDILDVTANVAGTVFGGIFGLAQHVPGVGGLMDIFGHIEGFDNRVYRSIRQMDTEQQVIAALGAVAAGGAVAGGLIASPFTGGTTAAAGLIGASAILGATGVTAVTNHNEFAELWSESGNGEAVFLDSAKQEALDLIDDPTIVALASEIAFQTTPYDLIVDIAAAGNQSSTLTSKLDAVASELAEPGTPEYQQVRQGLDKLMANDAFLQAVKTLQNGKISYGRDVARLLGLDPTSNTYHAVSGSVDGFTQIALDPFILSKPIAQANKFRRYGVGGDIQAPFRWKNNSASNRVITGGAEARVQLAYKNGRVGRLISATDRQIAAAVEAGDFNMMPKSYRGIFDELEGYRKERRVYDPDYEFTMQEFHKWIEESDNFAHLVAGVGTVKGVTGTLLFKPDADVMLTNQFKNRAREVITTLAEPARLAKLEKRLEKLDPDGQVIIPASTLDTPLHKELVKTSNVTEGAARNIDPAHGVLLTAVSKAGGATLGRLIDTMTNMAPRGGFIRLAGEGAAEDIVRFVNGVFMAVDLPSQYRKQWIKDIMAEGTVGGRAQLLFSFYDTVFRASGLMDTKRGKELWEDFVSKHQQKFGAGNSDKISVRGQERHMYRGVLASHQALAMAVPDMREMIKAARYQKIYGDALGAVKGDALIDVALNKVWKPSVILRLGFIPRAGGEELLALLMRGADGQLGAELGARRLMRREQWEQMRDSIEKQLEHKQPLTEAQQLVYDKRNSFMMRPLERMASRLEFAADPIRSFVEGYERALRALLDPTIASQMKGRRNLAELIDRQNPLVQALLVGVQGSWRRTAIKGLDRELLSSSREWMRKHAHLIMNETSAGVQSKAVDVQKGAVETRLDGTHRNITVKDDRGRRQLVNRSDDQYARAYLDQVEEIINDEYAGSPFIDATVQYRPASIKFDDTTLKTVFDNFETLSPYQQDLVLNVLFSANGKLDNFALRLERAGFDDDLVAVLRDAERNNMIDFDRLREVVARTFTSRDKGVNQLNPTQLAALDQLLDVIGTLRADSSALVQRAWLLPQLDYLKRNPERFKQLLGLDQFDIPTYNTSHAQWQAALEDRLTARLRDNPNLSANILNSDRLVQDRSGTPVIEAVRKQPNSVRYYSPHVDGYTRLLGEYTDLRNQGFTDYQIIEELARKFGDTVDSGRPYSPYVTSLTPEARIQAMRLALTDVIQSEHYRLVHSPVVGVSYADPRIANWVSEVLSDRVIVDPYKQLHYVDFPRNTLNKSGDKFQSAEAIHENDVIAVVNSWQTIDRMQPIRGKVYEDGTYGISQEEAWADAARATTEHAMFTTGTDSTVRYKKISDDAEVYQRVDDEFVLSEATEFDAEDVLYDKDGKLLSVLDKTDVFEPLPMLGDDVMWEVIGPRIADRLDWDAGAVAYEEKLSYRTLPNQRDQFVDNVPLTWGRDSDLAKTRAPQVIAARIPVYDAQGVYDRVINFGFNKVITPALDAIAREPMSFHNFVTMRRTARSNLLYLVDDTAVTSLNRRLRKSNQGRELVDQHVAAPFRDADMKATSTGRAMGAYDIVVDRVWNNAAEANQQVIEYLRRNVSLDEFNSVFSDIFNVKNYDEYNTLLDDLQKLDNWNHHVDEVSSRAAVANLEPFLDTSEQRSMFSLYYKNMLPFWYAEENFIKRWLRGAMLNGNMGLDQIRKLQLGYSGLRATGIVHTDENGTDWFVYPGSGMLSNLLGAVTPLSTENVGVMFASTTESMLPGFNSEAGKPGVGPLAQIPLKFTSKLFPEMRVVERAIVGDIGTGATVSTALFPASARRVFDAIQGDENNPKFIAAMDSAMIMLQAQEATRLPNDASPAEIEEFLQRAKNHARIIMWSGAITGFISMGAPTPITSGVEFKDNPFAWLTGIGITDPAKAINSEYRSYLQTYGYEEGVDRYLAAYPDAVVDDIVNPLAFTVSRTETVGGRSVPATEAGLQWANDNSQFLADYRFAGAWFAPIPDEVDEFSRYAYQEFFNNGVRRSRPPREVLESLIFQRSSNEYFAAQERWEQTIRNSDDSMRPIHQKMYEQWKTDFFAVNPLFKSMLQSTDNAVRREQTLSEMRQALNDPLMPDTEASDAYRRLIEQHDLYQARRANLGGPMAYSTRDKQEELKMQFVQYGEAWASRYPKYASFWSTVVKLAVT